MRVCIKAVNNTVWIHRQQNQTCFSDPFFFILSLSSSSSSKSLSWLSPSSTDSSSVPSPESPSSSSPSASSSSSSSESSSSSSAFPSKPLRSEIRRALSPLLSSMYLDEKGKYSVSRFSHRHLHAVLCFTLRDGTRACVLLVWSHISVDSLYSSANTLYRKMIF